MKYGAMFLAVGAASVLLAATPVLGDNILVNPGFESGGMDPWYQDADFGGPEDWNVTSAEAHTGTYSATDDGNKRIRQDFAAIPTEDITEISLWLKQPEATIASIHFFYSDGSDDQGGILNLLGTDWEFFDVTNQLAPGKELTGFAIWGYMGGPKGPDRTYLDDVRVIPEPAMLSLLVLGGLAMARRRR